MPQKEARVSRLDVGPGVPVTLSNCVMLVRILSESNLFPHL